MLTLLPVLNYLLLYIFQYLPTDTCMHLPTLLLSVLRETIHFHSKCVDPSFWMTLQQTVLFLLQDLHCKQDFPLTCSWCWRFVYQYSLSLRYDPVAQQRAKWDALMEPRSRLWSQAKVIPNALCGSWAAVGAHLTVHFHRGCLLCPQLLAPGVIAVNPVIGAWVCAFQEREITQERQEESS